MADTLPTAARAPRPAGPVPDEVPDEVPGEAPGGSPGGPPAAAPARRRRLSRAAWGYVVGVATILVLAGVLLTVGHRLPLGSTGWWTVTRMRLASAGTIVVVAFCQSVATVLFHTATGNRILTPSILGFDALYRVMQTALVFVLGAGALAATDSLGHVAVQSLLMIGAATALYGWLFSGRRADLHVLLLVGVVLGMGFGALATFMQRLLTPSEFDILSARLFGNVGNADARHLPYAALVCVVVGVVVWRRRHRLDVLALGRDTATSLGLHHRRETLLLLVLVAVLVSVSTTLVGPLTFFGFVVASLTYQVAGGGAGHTRLLPLAVVLGTAGLLAAYVVLRHVFYAGGLVSVIIELGGGLLFLVLLLRKGLR